MSEQAIEGTRSHLVTRVADATRSGWEREPEERVFRFTGVDARVDEKESGRVEWLFNRRRNVFVSVKPRRHWRGFRRDALKHDDVQLRTCKKGTTTNWSRGWESQVGGKNKNEKRIGGVRFDAYKRFLFLSPSLMLSLSHARRNRDRVTSRLFGDTRDIQCSYRRIIYCITPRPFMSYYARLLCTQNDVTIRQRGICIISRIYSFSYIYKLSALSIKNYK